MCLISRAEFGDGQQQTYSCSLGDVVVDFKHMMLPLPWKPDNESTSFPQLWDWVVHGVGGSRLTVVLLLFSMCSFLLVRTNILF